MTLVLGLVCAEGVVLASDGQATYLTGGQQVKGRIKKLYPQWRNVAWAASGQVGVAQRAQQFFAGHSDLRDEVRFENRTPETTLDEICGALRPELRSYYQNEILVSQELPSPLTTFLFCGWVKDGPVLFEIGADLIVIDHREVGYAAIGSGDIFPYFALASLAHHKPRECSLPMATLIAHRVVSDAITVAAHGLGPPIQIITIRNGEEGKVREDIDAIEDGVKAWQEIESDALRKHIDQSLDETSEP